MDIDLPKLSPTKSFGITDHITSNAGGFTGTWPGATESTIENSTVPRSLLLSSVVTHSVTRPGLASGGIRIIALKVQSVCSSILTIGNRSSFRSDQ